MRCALVGSPEVPEEVSSFRKQQNTGRGEANGSKKPVRAVTPGCGDPLILR